MLLLAEVAVGATPYIVGLLSSGGLIMAVIALVKLRGDRDSQAVSQAQGAMETMDTLLDALKDSLKSANARGDFYKHRCEDLEARLAAIELERGTP